MHVQIGFSGLPLRIIPVLTSVVTMTMASFVYLPVVVNGGVGKNGSTIAVSLLDIIVKTAFHVIIVCIRLHRMHGVLACRCPSGERCRLCIWPS